MQKCGRKWVVTVLFLAGTIAVCAQTAPRASVEMYSRVRVFLQNPAQIADLARRGLQFDHAVVEKSAAGEALIVVVNAAEMEILRQSGIPYQVQVADLTRDFLSRPALSAAEQRQIRAASAVRGFEFGSMGGYYTFAEALAELDSMRLLYPHLITARQSIGTSQEGRGLWMVKISDNPEVDEAEPEVLYDALHHAREPQSLMTLIYYMYYLLENYGTDPEVTYLVDNRELYFIPVVNPDGYVYNQTTNPNGGGFWRKNRRNNGNGTFGVDLNRNYGYEWGFDNVGSSPNTGSDTYRGPAPFSEPETQAMRDFCIARQFMLALNYHTYSNLLIYPWGYIADFLTPDSALFIEYAADMTQFNHYAFGTGNQTVGYLVNGDSDDWMYGEQSVKNKILAMTPEVGSAGDGFWPSQNRIYPLAEENLYPNLFVARVAGEWVKPGSYRLVDAGNQNGFIDAGETVKMVVDLKNIGLSDAADVSVALRSTDPYVTILPARAHRSVSIPARGESVSDTLTFTVAGNAPNAHRLDLTLSVSFNGYTLDVPVANLLVGTPVLALASDAENGTTGWSTGLGWNTTTADFVSPTHAFTDSPFGNYGNSTDNALTLQTPLDLSAAEAAFLTFWTRWDIEANWDFAQVQASADGINWTPLSGMYTRPGSGNGVQLPGEPGYDGSQPLWVNERMDLAAFVGQPQVYLRFRMRSDFSVTRDGWYMDDVTVHSYQPSAAVFTMNMSDGWNLISLPLSVTENDYLTLFPNAVPNTLFRYDGTYLAETTLAAGTGYWLNFATAENVPVSGSVISSIDIPLAAGWNLIGGISCDVPAAGISDPGGIIVPNTLYEFAGTYLPATEIRQGRGYWIHAAEAGVITLGCAASVEKSPPVLRGAGVGPHPGDKPPAHTLIVREHAETPARELYFHLDLPEETARRVWLLPPLPPAGTFDARFRGGWRGIGAGHGEIRVQSAHYPLKITARLPLGVVCRLEERIAGAPVRSHLLRDGQTIRIADQRVNTLYLSAGESNAPTSFVLAQNYPNPFNPATVIRYQLPEKARVTLTVYDIGGSEVKTLVRALQSPGSYEIQWDGTNRAGAAVASGVYLYRLAAGAYKATGKMLLVR